MDSFKELFENHSGSPVAAIALVVVGAVVCFFGRRVLKPTLAVAGFVVGLQIGNVALTYFHKHFDPSNQVLADDSQATVIIPIVIGAVLGIVFMNLVHLAMYLLAAAGGMMLFSVVRDALKDGSLQHDMNPNVRVVLMVLSGLVPILLVSFLERVVVSAATSIIGSALVLVGVDLFVNKGFLSSVRSFWRIRDEGLATMTAEVKDRLQDKDVLTMFGGFAALAVVGALYQVKFGSK